MITHSLLSRLKTPDTRNRDRPEPGDGSVSFLSGLLSAIADRARRLRRERPPAAPAVAEPRPDTPIVELCEALLSVRGEASRVALASQLLARWRGLSGDARKTFLAELARDFGADRERLDRAIEAYRIKPDAAAILELHQAAEPSRQELFRRLNLAPYGTATLLRIREELLSHLGKEDFVAELDADFVHLFTSWFNRGFLVLRRIDWTAPANILEKIIRYEAVHTIHNWNDLRRRVSPADRACFAFFHPQLIDEPLIFVEVALTTEIPDAIEPLLSPSDRGIGAHMANTAVFYSISNCQKGLRGIALGDFLIKQVVEELTREQPNLTTFVTLSPTPGFASWLSTERRSGTEIATPDRELLALLDRPGWHETAEANSIREALLRAASLYLLRAKDASGRPLDPVARFHLGNGSRLDRLNFLADLSERGLRQAHGLMVNYLYKFDEIEANHERYATSGEIAASEAVRRFLPPAPTTTERSKAEA